MSKDSEFMTRRKKQRVDEMVEAVVARVEETQSLAFAAREFVTCGLPLKKPKGLVHERSNGKAGLQIIGHPKYGLPYGQDRLIPIWLASAFFAAGKPTDNIIRFRSARDILRMFRIDGGGSQIRMLRQRIERVFHATFLARCHTSDWPMKGRPPTALQRYQLMSQVHLWFEKSAPANQYTLWNNVIKLDSQFADDLRNAGRVPIDLESVIALKDNPGALDFYVWQAWRSFRVKRSRQSSVVIPLFGDEGLMAAFGSTSSGRKARQMLRRWHEEVLKVWQDCPNTLQQDTMTIYAAEPVRQTTQLIVPGVVRNPPQPRSLKNPLPMILVRPDDHA
jgi:hypothetical protein